MSLRARFIAPLLLAALCSAGPATGPARAQATEEARLESLRIGLAAGPTSLDPHYENRPHSRQIAMHLFDALTVTDDRLRLKPSLAESWEAPAENHWVFRLRDDVFFHDGAPLTADDVAFSIERALDEFKSPLSFGPLLNQIERIEAEGWRRIDIFTRTPQPRLPYYLSYIAIMSRAAAVGRTREELDRGEGLVGTGPYRFIAWEPGVKLTLAANRSHWRGAEPWSRIDFYPLAAPEARLEALNSALVDVVEAPLLGEVAALTGVQGVALVKTVSNRLVYIQVDHGRDSTPDVRNAGDSNPFKSLKVRQALSLAVDREGLVEEVLSGEGTPAGQVTPDGLAGHVEGLVAPERSVDAAKLLLEDAGFGQGFSATLAAPADRFPRGAEVAQFVAGNLTDAGLVVDANILPRAVFYARRNREAFSLYISTLEIGAGGGAAALADLLATPDPEAGLGRRNRGNYSNPELDKLLSEAARTVDMVVREELLQRAGRLAIEDVAVIPLYFDFNRWAVRADLDMLPRADELTLATDIRRRAVGSGEGN